MSKRMVDRITKREQKAKVEDVTVSSFTQLAKKRGRDRIWVKVQPPVGYKLAGVLGWGKITHIRYEKAK